MRVIFGDDASNARSYSIFNSDFVFISFIILDFFCAFLDEMGDDNNICVCVCVFVCFMIITIIYFLQEKMKKSKVSIERC